MIIKFLFYKSLNKIIIMLAYLKSFVYNDLDINKYSKILEFVPKHEEKITNQLFSDEELIDHIRQFCISEKN